MADNDAAEVRLSAEALYAQGQCIWDSHDLWNAYKRAQISKFVEVVASHPIANAELALNAGSGGEGYDWLPRGTINSDLFLEQVRKLPRAVVNDIAALPFPDSTFDLCVCVGSVLNYASAIEAIYELCRVLKPGGYLILHYESSNSFEHWLTRNWNRAVARIVTTNSGHMDKIWVYAPSFIADILARCDLTIRAANSFHILSSVASRLGFKQNVAATLARYDHWFAALRNAADDQIILAEKIA